MKTRDISRSLSAVKNWASAIVNFGKLRLRLADTEIYVLSLLEENSELRGKISQLQRRLDDQDEKIDSVALEAAGTRLAVGKIINAISASHDKDITRLGPVTKKTDPAVN